MPRRHLFEKGNERDEAFMFLIYCSIKMQIAVAVKTRGRWKERVFGWETHFEREKKAQ
jgi:hypothetical protein